MSSPIQTVTVGFGITPNQPHLRLVGYNHRWGIAPRPEDCLLLYTKRCKKCKEFFYGRVNAAIRPYPRLCDMRPFIFFAIVLKTTNIKRSPPASGMTCSTHEKVSQKVSSGPNSIRKV